MYHHSTDFDLFCFNLWWRWWILKLAMILFQLSWTGCVLIVMMICSVLNDEDGCFKHQGDRWYTIRCQIRPWYATVSIYHDIWIQSIEYLCLERVWEATSHLCFTKRQYVAEAYSTSGILGDILIACMYLNIWLWHRQMWSDLKWDFVYDTSNFYHIDMFAKIEIDNKHTKLNLNQ